MGGVVVLLAWWWGFLAGAWMLLVDTVSSAEVACAVAAALAGVVITRLVFGSGIAGMRPTVSLCSGLARQLARVPVDMWLLAVALGRALAGHRRAGRFYELSLRLAVNENGNARRAGIELLGSLAPNTIVLGVDEQRVVVHQLVARQRERAGVREIGS
jgi:multisubunit Na+/H+ antiporter MnhE subunit